MCTTKAFPWPYPKPADIRQYPVLSILYCYFPSPCWPFFENRPFPWWCSLSSVGVASPLWCNFWLVMQRNFLKRCMAWSKLLRRRKLWAAGWTQSLAEPSLRTLLNTNGDVAAAHVCYVHDWLIASKDTELVFVSQVLFVIMIPLLQHCVVVTHYIGWFA